MAFAETANLAVKLTLGGNFNSQLAKTRAGLKSLDRESRAFKAGGQIGTGIKRGALIAVGAIGALTGLLIQSAREGQEAANVQKVFAQSIVKSGKVSKDYVKILDDQQHALMNLAGVDDELIKAEQTKLIQFGLSGKAVAKLTPLILDAAKATGKDLLTVTVAAGKAANGNAGALQKMGIFVDKVRFKANPLAETLRVLNKRFGGTAKVLSGSLDTRLNVLRENLANVREEAGQKLLPALIKIVDAVGIQLVPAFGKFVDRMLPSIIDGMDKFANALQRGGAEDAINGITDALGPMIDLVKVAAAPVKAIVQAFLSLPKEVQTVLIGAFAVNKLTGGLVTNAAGGIIEAIGKGLLGGIKAPLVNVTGGVVNVGGGLPGGGGGLPGGIGGAGAAGGVAASAAEILALSGVAGALVGIEAVLVHSLLNPTPAGLARAAQGRTDTATARGIPASNNAGVIKAIKDLDFHDDNRAHDLRERLDLKGALAAIEKRSKEAGKEPTQQQILATFRRNLARQDAISQAAQAKADAAIRASKDTERSVDTSGRNGAAASREAGRVTATALHHLPVPTTNIKINVSVTPGAIQKSTTIQTSYGPANGSSGGGHTDNGIPDAAR